jgi:hypothetical protein
MQMCGGRGSWIRTNDLQYPKLPRYQAALYPDYLGNQFLGKPITWETKFLGNNVDTRLKRAQQAAAMV